MVAENAGDLLCRAEEVVLGISYEKLALDKVKEVHNNAR